MNDQEKHPSYYTLADGRGFEDFSADELFPLLCDDLTHIEYHAVIAAFEHYFRSGLKPGEKGDMEKYDWWMTRARNRFCRRHYAGVDFVPLKGATDFQRIIKPALALVHMERNNKISAMK